ncbi:MAG: right-handed parallel beta-helix repeat-containing protein, partial [Chryseobacterium sp.]
MKNTLLHSIKMLLALMLLQSSGFAKIQTNWGTVYDVRYNASSTPNIPSSTQLVSNYFMDTSTGFVKYIVSQINSNPNQSDFTIVFPKRDYLLDKTLNFNLGGVTTHPKPYTINFIGYDTLPTSKITSISNTHIASTMVQNNVQDPSDTNFLTYGGVRSNFPIIKVDSTWVRSTSEADYIVRITTKNSNIMTHAVNVMGFHIEGIQKPTYFDGIFGYMGLIVGNFNEFNIDNNWFENIYGDALYASCGAWSYDTNAQTRNNLKATFEKNVILNCWGLNPTADQYNGCSMANNACPFDNYGDGIQINGLNNATISENYIDNNIATTGQFGQGGIVLQHDANCVIERNFIKGYDRNIHVETSNSSYIIRRNRSLGSFTSMLVSEASMMATPMYINDNYFSTEGTPTPIVYDPANNPYKPILGLQLGFVNITNGGVAVGNPGNSADGCVFKNNTIVTRSIDYNNWFDNSIAPTSNNYSYFGQLIFDLSHLTLECNTFKSLVQANAPNSRSQMISTHPSNPDAYKSYKGNTFIGTFAISIGGPTLNQSIVAGNDYSGIVAIQSNGTVDPTYQANAGTSVDCSTTCASTYLSNSTYTYVNNQTLGSVLTGTNFTGNKFYVEGDFVIDHNVTFSGCEFYFETNARMLVNAGLTVSFNSNCQLKKACEGNWLGVFANDPSTFISIVNSTMEDAFYGLAVSNDALLRASDNIFRNNITSSIEFKNISNANYGGWVRHNLFTSDISAGNINKPFSGIRLINSAYITIGDASNTAYANTFEHLENGISVLDTTLLTVTSNIKHVGIY